jgi:hypothetical protein
MNVSDDTLVIVRGINSDWLQQNFTDMWVGFGGNPVAIPKEDAYFVGFYLEAPISAITHLGIVERIERDAEEAIFYIKAIIKLQTPYIPDHQIRKHVYYHLDDFGFSKPQADILRLILSNI